MMFYAKKYILIKWIHYIFLLHVFTINGDLNREVYNHDNWEYLLYTCTCITKVASYMYFSVFMYVYKNSFLQDQFEINIGSCMGSFFAPLALLSAIFLSLALPVIFSVTCNLYFVMTIFFYIWNKQTTSYVCCSLGSKCRYRVERCSQSEGHHPAEGEGSLWGRHRQYSRGDNPK